MIKLFGYCLLIATVIYTHSVYSSPNVLNGPNETDDAYIKTMERILVVLLEKCEFNRKNVVIYDDRVNSSAFKYLTALQSVRAVSLLTTVRMWTGPVKPLPNNTAIELIILVVSPKTALKNVVEYLSIYWVISKNCSIIQIPYEPRDACDSVVPMLRNISRTYVTSSYYVCVNSKNQPYIYTMDFNGDRNPVFWKVVDSQPYRARMTFLYRRDFQEDNICQGFFFEQSDQLDSIIVLGVNSRFVIKPLLQFPNMTYDDSALEFIDPRFTLLILLMQKLMKFKMVYNIPNSSIYSLPGTEQYIYYSYMNLPDIFYSFVNQGGAEEWVLTIPIIEDAYVILTHNLGLATPLEKIGRFYGYVTLIGIIIISTVTFIVIWLIKSISLGAFDVLRLWINTGIFVPMKTNSSRIFFFGIFVFFTVFHATFSGNIAKFLTSTALRKNADTIADLEDSRIEKIYNLQYSYEFDDIDDLKMLNEKTIMLTANDPCRTLSKENPKSACISNRLDLVGTLDLDTEYNRYYISNSIRELTLHLGYRVRMPWTERFNWFLMVITELGLVKRNFNERYNAISTEILMRNTRLQIDFRPIKLDDLIFAFILLGIGLTLSTICFVFELLINYRHKKNLNKNKNHKIITNFNITVLPSVNM